MKHSKLLAGLLLAIAFAMVASIALSGCAQQGDVKEQRAQQENIAAACSGITVAGNAIAGYAEAASPESKAQAKALAAQALAVAKPTKDFCEPKPATYLTPTDLAALLTAAAELKAMKERTR